MDAGARALVEDLFRRSAGRLVARLTRALGPRHLELAEEAVQDALVRALQRWPYQGVPDRPEAWLFTVARNRALDRLRRRNRWEAEAPEGDVAVLSDALQALSPPGAAPDPRSGPLDDDELALVFGCCHPSLPEDGAVALTLNTVGGLGAREIAAAFRVPETTLAQRIVRAKRALRALPSLALPGEDELPRRRSAVLKTLYLLFNEGYAASEGDLLVRQELCAEAIRLAGLLADHPRLGDPEVDALLALMLLQASRLPARTDAGGGLLILAEQDRSRWDRDLRDRGLARLERARRGDVLTAYHIEAGIASCHAVAPSFEATDWHAILTWYDLLERAAPSPVVTINRAVALGMARGPEAGLAALENAAPEPALMREPLLPAVQGWLLSRAGRPREARQAYGRAAALSRAGPVRRYLEARAREMETG